MAFRNPILLDDSLLTGLADFHHIELVGEAQIVRRTLAEREGRASIKTGVELGGSKGSTEEVTETYARNTRPVRNVNDVIDHLLKNELLVDLVEDLSQSVAARDVVQVEGDITLHAATEIGAVLGALMPDLVAAGPGGDVDEATMKAKLFRTLAGGESDREVVHVFEMDTEDLLRVVLICNPKALMDTRVWDDVEGERTVVGVVEKLLPEGRTYSLERQLLPGLNRTFRRAIKVQGGLGPFLESCAPLLGREVNQNDVAVTGPALIVQPMAVF